MPPAPDHATQPKIVSPRDGHNYLPRLPREYYRGDAVVHWTLTTFDRAEGWLTESFHVRFRELMLHTSVRHGISCPTYCLMPDHVHIVWMGLWLKTDQREAMAFFRTYLAKLIAPAKFQPQAHDHVLRDEQRLKNAFAKVCAYVLENPVRKGLVSNPGEWEFNGAVVPGYPELDPLSEEFWNVFWKLYQKTRHPDAGQIKRPPFNFT